MLDRSVFCKTHFLILIQDCIQSFVLLQIKTLYSVAVTSFLLVAPCDKTGSCAQVSCDVLF